jgi:hypothetical protein
MPLRNRKLEMGNKPVKGVADAVDAKDAVNKAQMDAAIAAVDLSALVPNTRLINTTSGELTGGGDLTADRTLALADTAVAPATYTFATVTVDAKGRVTSAANGTPPDPPPWTTIFKSADQSFTSNISPTDLTDLSFAADASSTYVVRFVLFIVQGAGGARWDIEASSAVTLGFRAEGFASGTALALDVDGTTGAFAGNYCIEYHAFIQTNAAATISLRGAQNTSDASATTFKQGTFLEYRKVS